MNELVAGEFKGRAGEVVGWSGKANKGGDIVYIAYYLCEAPSDQHGCVEGRASSLEYVKRQSIGHDK